jgi:predicted regulator of Ras-like GTPase activity (Roadblock/LC7/MglB family)
MSSAAKEWRHLILISAIVAAIPLLVYPSSLGVETNMSLAFYVILELIYFAIVFQLLNRGASASTTLSGVIYILIGRLSLSAIFWLFLLALGDVGVAVSFSQAFFTYKPALFLFSLTAPVIYNSVSRILTEQDSDLRTKESARPSQLVIRRTQAGAGLSANLSGSMVSPSREPDVFDQTLEGAVRHVGQFSGVISAILIDEDGLPVVSFSRTDEEAEDWAAVALQILTDLKLSLTKIEKGELDRFEFECAGKRCSLLPAANMWLLAIANAAADDLEKIRMQQAAVMISRYYQERYDQAGHLMTESRYEGSTVGA